MGGAIHERARRSFGLTLVELMIVVAIIAVIAAIALPNLLSFQAKARQAEARANLGGIFAAQQGYRAYADTYGSFSEIGFVSSHSGARIYTYRDGVEVQPGKSGLVACPNATVSAVVGATGFTATAVGTISNSGIDCWYVNDQRQFVNWNRGY
jgi:prepilin-type N-terminal cleavage/methylation domain-containing protein